MSESSDQQILNEAALKLLDNQCDKLNLPRVSPEDSQSVSELTRSSITSEKEFELDLDDEASSIISSRRSSLMKESSVDSSQTINRIISSYFTKRAHENSAETAKKCVSKISSSLGADKTQEFLVPLLQELSKGDNKVLIAEVLIELMNTIEGENLITFLNPCETLIKSANEETSISGQKLLKSLIQKGPESLKELMLTPLIYRLITGTKKQKITSLIIMIDTYKHVSTTAKGEIRKFFKMLCKDRDYEVRVAAAENFPKFIKVLENQSSIKGLVTVWEDFFSDENETVRECGLKSSTTMISLLASDEVERLVIPFLTSEMAKKDDVETSHEPVSSNLRVGRRAIEKAIECIDMIPMMRDILETLNPSLVLEKRAEEDIEKALHKTLMLLLENIIYVTKEHLTIQSVKSSVLRVLPVELAKLAVENASKACPDQNQYLKLVSSVQHAMDHHRRQELKVSVPVGKYMVNVLTYIAAEFIDVSCTTTLCAGRKSICSKDFKDGVNADEALKLLANNAKI